MYEMLFVSQKLWNILLADVLSLYRAGIFKKTKLAATYVVLLKEM
jgi:hypothetical protein